MGFVEKTDLANDSKYILQLNEYLHFMGYNAIWEHFTSS